MLCWDCKHKLKTAGVHDRSSLHCSHGTVLTISKYWKNPQFMFHIWEKGMSATVSLDDFLEAVLVEVGGIVVKELGSVTFRISNKNFQADLRAALEKDIRDAFPRIIRKMKEEAAKVA